VPLQLSNHPPVGHPKRNVQKILVGIAKLIEVRTSLHTGGRLFPVRLRIENALERYIYGVVLFLA
jgi:hypothetical protein